MGVQVDFSNVEGEIERLEENAKRKERELLQPLNTPASGKGVAFHAALAEATGASGMPNLPPELAALPQPARVRKLAGPLHQLFMQYDEGDMDADVFRERLRAMGLRENLEVDRLLRQQGVGFAQLFKALAMQGGNDMPSDGQAAGQATDRTPSGGVFGTRHNASPAASRRIGKRTGFKDLRAASAVDPVSWRGKCLHCCVCSCVCRFVVRVSACGCSDGVGSGSGVWAYRRMRMLMRPVARR